MASNKKQEAVGAGTRASGEKEKSSPVHLARLAADNEQEIQLEAIPAAESYSACDSGNKRRAGSSLERPAKRILKPDPDLGDKEEEAEEVEFVEDRQVAGEGQLAEFRRLQATDKRQEVLTAFIPEILGRALETGTAGERCARFVRECSLKLFQDASQPNRLNKVFAEYIVKTGSEVIGPRIMECLTEPMIGFIGSEIWSREELLRLAASDLSLNDNGCYFIVVSIYGYLGSTGNFKWRFIGHDDEIAANRAGDRYAERKLFYEQCCRVPNAEARFIYMAINKYRKEGEFLETMESVLISIFDMFDRGRLTPYSRQVAITKGMRPAGLPERDWEPGNASLPVCMGYTPKLTPELRALVNERAKALGMEGGDEAVRSMALERQLKRMEVSRRKFVWCDHCKHPVAGTHWDQHFHSRLHQQNLPEEERTQVPESFCATCGLTVATKSWDDHVQSTAHQKKLAAEERDRSVDTWCDVCETSVKSIQFKQHLKTKHHIAKAEGRDFKEVERKTKFCDVCQCDRPAKDFARHCRHNKKHLAELARQEAKKL